MGDLSFERSAPGWQIAAQSLAREGVGELDHPTPPLLQQCRTTAKLAVNASCDAIRSSAGRSGRTLAGVLRIVLILNLGIRNTDTLRRHPLGPSPCTLAGKVAVRHHHLYIHIGAAAAASFTATECAGGNVGAGVEVLYDLPTGRVQCAGKAEVRQGALAGR